MFENLKTIPTAGLKRLDGARQASGLVAPAAGIEGERVFRQKFERRSTIHALRVSNAARAMVRLPDDGEVVHLLMSGNFDGWDYVTATLRLAAPATIAELYIATLGFSDANAGELLHYLDTGQVRRVWFLASCYMRDSSGHIYLPLAAALRARGQHVAASRNHCKLILMRLSDGRHVGVDGSMNLRSCRNIEQANVWQSRELFDFYAGYIRDTTEAAANVR